MKTQGRHAYQGPNDVWCDEDPYLPCIKRWGEDCQDCDDTGFCWGCGHIDGYLQSDEWENSSYFKSNKRFELIDDLEYDSGDCHEMHSLEVIEKPKKTKRKKGIDLKNEASELAKLRVDLPGGIGISGSSESTSQLGFYLGEDELFRAKS